MDFEEVLKAWGAIAGAGQPVEVRVSGGSMRPLIAPGCVLTVRPCGADELRPGDIVVARAGGRVVAHRMVRRSGGRIVLRGDALDAPDPPLDPANVLGRAVRLAHGRHAIDLDGPLVRAAARLLAGAPALTRTAAASRAPLVRAVERLWATAPARFLRRPRRLDTLVQIATPAEAAVLRTLVLDSGSPTWLPGPAADGTVVVAMARGAAVGCAWCVGNRLRGVFVRAGWRRLGIGRTMLEVAVGAADEPVRTDSPPDERSAACYRAVGFTPTPDGEWVRMPTNDAGDAPSLPLDVELRRR